MKLRQHSKLLETIIVTATITLAAVFIIAHHDKIEIRFTVIATVVTVVFSLLAVALIRERRQYQETLEQLNNHNWLILESAGEGIYGIDMEGRITFVNPKAAEMLGYTPDELIGRGSHETFHYRKADGSPYPVHECPVYSAITQGTEHRIADDVFLRKEGTSFPVEYYSTSIRKNGAIVGAVVVFADITGRKQAEEALRESEERHRQVLESTGSAMIIVEEDTTISLANNEFSMFSGYSKDEIEGKLSWTIFADQVDRERMLEYHRLRRIDPTSAPTSYEFRFVDRFGRKRDILSSVTVISGTRKSVASYMDITDLKRAERLLSGKKLVLEKIASEAPLPEVLDIICSIVEEHASGALCSLFLVDADGKHLRLGAAPSLPETFHKVIGGTRIGPDSGPCGTAAFTGQQVIASDIATDPLWEKYKKLLLDHGLKACWSRPIISNSGKVLGTFAIYYREPHLPIFSELLLMERITHLASIVIERKHSEESLRKIQMQQQAILDNIPDLVWLKDKESRFITVNEAFARSCGSTPQELVGNSDLDIWPADLAAKYRHDDMRVMTTGEKKCVEEPLEDSSGNRKWIETIKTPIYGDNGEVVGTTGIAREIDDRKRIEEALRENEARLAKAQQIAHIGNWDWNIITNELHWSEEIFRIFSLPPHEFEATYEAFIAAVHPDDRNSVEQAVSAALKDRTLYRIKHRIVCPNGEIRHVHEQGEVEFDAEGNPVRMQGTVQDITEQTLAELAYRESEERFHQLFDQNEDAIVLLKHENFDIIDANPSVVALTGYTRDELFNSGPWAFIAPEDYQKFIQTVPRGDDFRTFQLDRATTVSKDGSRATVSIRGKIMRLKDDQIIYCSIRDISQRVHLEETMRETQAKLIHTNKMTSLGMLVSGIAHEINNPNNFISFNSSLLAEAWKDASVILAGYHEEHGDFNLNGLPFSEMQEVIPRLISGLAEGSRRISSIVTNLKDFARQDASDHSSRIDINKTIRDATAILGHHIHKCTDCFTMSLAENLPHPRGKSQQMEQVVLNLIMNSLQALTDKKRGIEVSTAFDDQTGCVVICVRDQGKGMSREVMERLTEPFFTTRLDEGGTGLGLSISATILKEHNGSMEFESTPGEGTTATIRLPVE